MPLILWILFFSLHSIAQGGDQPATRYIHVNGGNTETSNFGPHETHLLAFYHTLFNQKVVALNAGGPSTRISPKGFPEPIPRGADGSIVLVPSTIPFPTLPATKINLKEQILAAGTDGVKKLTIVYDDHGGPNGPSLWLQDRITANELVETYKKLPKDTLVRALHDHCYGGAGIVDPKREVPKDLEAWIAYLDKYYPQNICALAMSSHDELGIYLEWGTTWEQSDLMKIIEGNKYPYLSAWKSRLADADRVVYLPPSTSDYLREDLFQFLCNSHLRKPNAFPHAMEVVDGGEARPENPEDRCAALLDDKEVREASETFLRAKQLYSESGEVRSYLAASFLEQKDGEGARYYQFQAGEIEKLKAEYSLKRTDGRLSDEDQKTYQAALEALRDTTYNNYLQKITNIEDKEEMKTEFRDYLKSDRVKAWHALESTKKDFPAYLAYIAEEKNKNKLVTQLRPQITNEADALQLKRKKLVLTHRLKKHAFLNSLLDRPELKPIADRLKEIDNCESSKLID